MTQLLEKAFSEAAKLLPSDQDALASWLLEDLIAERRWSETYRRTADALARLADEALAEHHAGRSLPMDLGEA